ncbi:acyl carrier protein [Hoeflea prorocentri]|uniref:Acyl carrier protein n=1 Tax=Hoeflea prorocentri TaxID=1922333 RepID=A0A9X3ZIM9_9HYPH|nr:hypothetical protein [Hoeflea prorocentri]MCY6382619.1 hypothetical protein [Hoeflea prorocentri]MDA5400419.1 hypothetical protein [Hoeflea prorocentri]
MNAIDNARRIVAEATHTPLDQLPEEAGVDTLESWDSIAHVNIILAVEEASQTQLTPEAIVSIVSVRTIAEILDGKTGSND